MNPFHDKRDKFCSNLKLNQITNNKNIWRPFLSDNYIQFSAITFTTIKMLSLMADMNANSRAKYVVDTAIEKYKD